MDDLRSLQMAGWIATAVAPVYGTKTNCEVCDWIQTTLSVFSTDTWMMQLRQSVDATWSKCSVGDHGISSNALSLARIKIDVEHVYITSFSKLNASSQPSFKHWLGFVPACIVHSHTSTSPIRSTSQIRSLSWLQKVQPLTLRGSTRKINLSSINSTRTKFLVWS